MTQLLVERVGKIGVRNGIIRIECLTAGPDGKPEVSGTLLMPTAEAGKTLNTMVKALQELQKKVQAELAAKAS